MNIGKKLLSLLTVFCLTLSLVPTVALAADATSVTVDGTSVVGSNTTYYRNNGTTSRLQTGSENNYNVTQNLTNNEASASTGFKISGTVKDGQKIVEGASVQLAPTDTANALASAVISTSTTTGNDGT